MDTKQESIWLDGTKKCADPRDQLACYAMELKSCEQLMVMGYTFSGVVKLADRASELADLIVRLEDKLGIPHHE